MFTIKLLETDALISYRITAGIAKAMNSKLVGGRERLRSEIINLVGIWIRSQPEMVSIGLSYNDPESLAGHFGLPYGSGRRAVEAIVSSIQTSTIVEIRKIDDKLRGGITIKVQPTNYVNLLMAPEGHVRTRKGGDLHWMHWLLEKGNTTIIVNYSYSPEGGSGRSRVGIMKKGGAWRVPPEFAGSSEDNFITRAFEGKERDLASLFNKILKG
jgi:hypothetical protein